MIDRVGAIHLVQKSSKSELSSRFFGRSKFWGAKKVEFSNGRLPPEDGSVRPQTLGKRVSDDPRHFIFRRRKKFSGKIVRRKNVHDTKKINRHFLKNYDKRPKKSYVWIVQGCSVSNRMGSNGRIEFLRHTLCNRVLEA